MNGSSILGVDIIVVPDDDERMKDVPFGSAVMQGSRMFVRESHWPALSEALRRETVTAPTSPTPTQEGKM